MTDPKYKFSQSGVYVAPPKFDHEGYVDFIKVLIFPVSMNIRDFFASESSDSSNPGSVWNARQCGYLKGASGNEGALRLGSLDADAAEWRRIGEENRGGVDGNNDGHSRKSTSNF